MDALDAGVAAFADVADATPIERLRAVGERYALAKALLDDIAKERRAAVLDALEGGESVSEVSRSAKLTREQVDRIRAGVNSGRKDDWRAARRAQAATSSDDT